MTQENKGMVPDQKDFTEDTADRAGRIENGRTLSKSGSIFLIFKD